MKRFIHVCAASGLCGFLWTAYVGAQSDAGTSTAVDAGVSNADAGRVWASCVESIPEGATRPKLTDTFPSKGLAGHALTLEVQVEHGLGETVLPLGFRIQADSDASRALGNAGFVLPDPNGGSAPSLSRRNEPDKAITEVRISFLTLPEKPGRHELTLPPIPIAVSRASGEYLTLCTAPHNVVVDEPIVDEPTPTPQGNPPPRPQREVWVLARDLAYGAVIGAVVAALVLWFVLWWKRRPKAPVPLPPPRPPWEIALESLDKVRREQLAKQGKRAEHVDRVSDVARIYLGARFGFDGIESTTHEVLVALHRNPASWNVQDEVRGLLEHSDLVKFARWSPSDEDCEHVLEVAERIVRTTIPADQPHDASPEPVVPTSVEQGETMSREGGQ